MDHHEHSFQIFSAILDAVLLVLVLSRMPYSLPKIEAPNDIRLRLPAGRLQQFRCGRHVLPLVDHVPKKTMLFNICVFL